jgi:6-phosphogluconolactonase (cycloisomerase 2 family)
MKFGKVGTVGKVTLVFAIALGLATLFTACSNFNVGFLFVATTKQSPGQIEVYEVDSQSGALRTIPTSPFPSGGRDPVAEAVAPNFKNLYVANEDDNNIVQFAIGTDGKLYAQSTINTPGSFPLAMAINAAGTYLYVVDTLAPVAGCTLANPCPGAIAVFPIDPTTGALDTPVANSNAYPNYWPLLLTSADATDVLTPTAVHVLASGSSVFVSATNTVNNQGYLFGFTVNSNGSLTELNNNAAICLNPSGTGCKTSQPVALASDSSNASVYVVDKLNDQVDSFSVSSLKVSSVASAGDQPSSLTLFNDKYLYVTNSLDSTVNAYSVNAGVLSKIGTYASDDNPVAVTVDPRNVGYLYTVNFLGSTLSGFQINPDTGVLINAQNGPYASSAQPVAISGVPRGGPVK